MTHSCRPRWRRLLDTLLRRQRPRACTCLLLGHGPVVHGDGSAQDPYTVTL